MTGFLGLRLSRRSRLVPRVRLLGFGGWEDLMAQRRHHQRAVRRQAA